MMGWWEVARGETVGEGSVGCLSRCRVRLPPMASASTISPFPASLAGSEPSVGIWQPLEDPSPGPASLCTAGELGKLLLLRSQVLCFAAASQGGRIRAERRREEMSFLPAPKPAGRKQGHPAMAGLGRDS